MNPSSPLVSHTWWNAHSLTHFNHTLVIYSVTHLLFAQYPIYLVSHVTNPVSHTKKHPRSHNQCLTSSLTSRWIPETLLPSPLDTVTELLPCVTAVSCCCAHSPQLLLVPSRISCCQGSVRPGPVWDTEPKPPEPACRSPGLLCLPTDAKWVTEFFPSSPTQVTCIVLASLG